MEDEDGVLRPGYVLAIAGSLVFSAFACGGRGESRGGQDGSAPDAAAPEAGRPAGEDGGAQRVAASLGCAKQLASGDDHTCILYDDGRVACLGGGGFGQLGNGSTMDAPAPVGVDGVSGARLLAAGGHHTCAITDGGLQCWGDNRSSELGVTGPEQSAEPVSVGLPGPRGVVQLALGSRHGCLLDNFVHGYCWGTGALDVELATAHQIPAIGEKPLQILQLGGSATRLIDGGRLYDVPWQADARAVGLVPAAPDGVVANAIADDHDCLLKSGGTVWCRGAGYPDFYAVVADFGNDVAEVGVGSGFTCARTAAGQVLCRGRNDSGQLGDTALPASDTAVTVPGIAGAVELSVGSAHACGRLADGSVWCWGALGGADARERPERVAGPAASQTCDGVTSVPRPWALPIPNATAADELADAETAWAQNQCRCALADPSALPACIQDETPLLNGCLEALGDGNEMQELCFAKNFWSEAACWATCVDDHDRAGIDACPPASVPDCGAQNGVMRFCMRRTLPCNGAASPFVLYSQTCDGNADCPNGFDEANCHPSSTQFRCADGASSVGIDLVWDDRPDCPDGSDEW
jgi:hypothetical protein